MISRIFTESQSSKVSKVRSPTASKFQNFKVPKFWSFKRSKTNYEVSNMYMRFPHCLRFEIIQFAKQNMFETICDFSAINKGSTVSDIGRNLRIPTNVKRNFGNPSQALISHFKPIITSKKQIINSKIHKRKTNRLVRCPNCGGRGVSNRTVTYFLIFFL